VGTITQRLPADKDGGEIISSILTDKDSQLERGTYEINHNADDRLIVTGTIPGVEFVQPGEMVEIVVKGESKKGLVVSCSNRIEGNSDSNTQITVELIK